MAVNAREAGGGEVRPVIMPKKMCGDCPAKNVARKMNSLISVIPAPWRVLRLRVGVEVLGVRV